MIPGTHYPLEMFHAEADKPRVCWSSEEQASMEADGWQDRQIKAKRGRPKSTEGE